MNSFTTIKQCLTIILLGLITFILIGGIIATIVIYEKHRPAPCNVAVVNLTGALVTSIDPNDTDEQQVTADQMDQQLITANNNSHIKAIVLNVDSPGGAPVAGEDIMNELKSITKPTVALGNTEEDSAAYIASLGANTIFAEDMSGVGDIGITSSYTDNSIKDQQDGITFNQISIGKYKDMGDTDKPLTADEKSLMMNQAQEDYNIFVQLVATNRHLPLATAQSLGNGEEYLGADAIKNGLIDHIGNMLDVQQYLSQKIGRRAVMCN